VPSIRKGQCISGIGDEKKAFGYLHRKKGRSRYPKQVMNLEPGKKKGLRIGREGVKKKRASSGIA